MFLWSTRSDLYDSSRRDISSVDNIYTANFLSSCKSHLGAVVYNRILSNINQALNKNTNIEILIYLRIDFL